MTKILCLLAVMVSAVFTVAQNFGDRQQAFDVRCPNCLDKQILIATSVVNNGSSSTNVNGVACNVVQRSANLHCPTCHSDFTAPIKPDLVVPASVAVATPVRPTPKLQSGKPATPVTSIDGEILRTIPQPDGYELIVIRRKTPDAKK